MRLFTRLMVGLATAIGLGAVTGELPELPKVSPGTRGHGHRSGRTNRKPKVEMKAAVQLCKRQVIPAKYRLCFR